MIYLIADCETRPATVEDVVAHINHIRSVAGVDSVGIGGDYNGVKSFPVGLEDVSGYPRVFAALIRDKVRENCSQLISILNYIVQTFDWTDRDLRKLAGENILRVFREVEKRRG